MAQIRSDLRSGAAPDPTGPGTPESIGGEPDVRLRDRIDLYGLGVDPVTESELIADVFAALDASRGGRIVTPNVDIMRIIRTDADARALVSGSDVIVADGMPLLWACRIARTPLPARVPGSDLIWSLSEEAAGRGRGIYLLGGDTGVPEKAADVLRERYPALRVAGTDSPPYGFDTTPQGVADVVAAVVAAAPDIVFVGLGFPRQERLMLVLSEALPRAWFLGCGASIPFVAGTLRRAPGWMQRHGLEWVHRMVSEPRRLFRRYVLHDAPFAVRLMTWAVRRRLRRR